MQTGKRGERKMGKTGFLGITALLAVLWLLAGCSHTAEIRDFDGWQFY
jgi:hypothetical protein